MSIRVHLERALRPVRVRPEDPPVSAGEAKDSVEETRLAAARKALSMEMYGSVAEYDPVLRSVCRLDREG